MREVALCARWHGLLVETIRLIGDYITLIIIISGQNLMEEWFTDLLAGYLVARSETGYSNNKLALDYIRHFYYQTKGLIQGRNRLLLIDGYGSYNTYKVVTYA